MTLTMRDRVELAGWGIFVVSALLFTAASLRAGDMLGLIGSGLFLFACFVFIGAICAGAGRGGSAGRRRAKAAGFARLRH